MKGFWQKKALCLAAFLAGAALANAEAPAAEKGSPAVLPEIVVTATRDQEEVRRVPAHVTVITEQEIRDSGAASLVEILERQEGIQFRSFTGQDPLAVIDLRGMGGDNPFGKVQIQLNGRRLNRPDMASVNWFQIPISQVERVEIVRGAGGVLHGDSAVAGVINIITKRGTGRPLFRLMALAGSYGLHSQEAGVSGSQDGLSYSVSGGNYFSLGYRNRSTVSSRGAGLDLGYDVSDALALSLAASFKRTRYELPGNLTEAEMAVDRRQYQPARPAYWTAASSDNAAADWQQDLSLRADLLLGALGRAEISFAAGRKEVAFDDETWRAYNSYAIDTYAVTPKYIWEGPLFGHRNKLTAGVDYYVEPFQLDRYASRQRTERLGAVEMERRTAGYYVRDELNLLEPLILSAGYRWEEAVIKGSSLTLASGTVDFDARKKHRGQAGEVGLNYLAGANSKVFAKYATAYRLPFLDEQASYYGWGNGFLADLEKETARTMEAGASLSPLANLTLGLTLFRIDMENEIAWNNAANRNENLDSTRHEGLEATFSFRWEGRAKLYGSYTYHRAVFAAGPYEGKELPLVPRQAIKMGLECYLPAGLVLRSEVRFVGDSYLSGDSQNSGEKLPSYRLYDLFLFHRPAGGSRRLTAFAGVENLGDEKYAAVGVKGTAFSPQTYYPLPGRTFKGGVSLEF